MCYPTLPKVPDEKTFQQHTDGYMKGSSLKQTDIHPARVVTMYSHHPNRSQTTVCITLGTVAWKKFFLAVVSTHSTRCNQNLGITAPILSISMQKKTFSLPGSTLCSPPIFFFLFFSGLFNVAARSPNCNFRGTFVRSLPSKEPPRHPRSLTVPTVGERCYRPQLSFFSTWTLGL